MTDTDTATTGSVTADTLPRTARNTASRERHNVHYDRALAYEIIDSAYFCHLGFTVPGPDGQVEPRVLPTLHLRREDTLYLHGSTGSGPMLAARSEQGLPVCVAVTHLDGLVLARSQFGHTANYRSVIVHGVARMVTDADEKLSVLTGFIDRMAPGRSADSRPANAKEMAETAVLSLALDEASAKVRAGTVKDDPSDLDSPYWAGVVPLRQVVGEPEPAPGVHRPVPQYLRDAYPVVASPPQRSAWFDAVSRHGTQVLIEPLRMSDVEELYQAIADAEVYQFLTRPCPTSVADMATEVDGALQAFVAGARVPFVLRLASTGEVAGTTSYYDIDPANRTIAIGYTALGRRWWRTAVNTEAKLLLLGRAFEELGAVRVQWHTDLRNLRSQASIERLGAVREGVQRKHRLLPDGSWRDTVLYSMTDDQWPAARQRLLAALSQDRAVSPEAVAAR